MAQTYLMALLLVFIFTFDGVNNYFTFIVFF